jgi:alpha-1,3-mannosylglycoprotein beta-1,4-N-acetylglucosaminyltransferase A/B
MYILDTLNSLLKYMTENEKKIHKIVILNADNDFKHQFFLNQTLFKKYFKEIEQEVISITIPPKSLYRKLEDPCKLAKNYGDSLIKVLWRSKQSLDTAYLMDYCKDMGDYYFHIEDDTPIINNWVYEILNWVKIFV